MEGSLIGAIEDNEELGPDVLISDTVLSLGGWGLALVILLGVGFVVLVTSFTFPRFGDATTLRDVDEGLAIVINTLA